MSIEITLPQIGQVKKSAKDLVISILMQEHPLNLAKITNTIRRKYGASVTFQGVRKAVNQLVGDQVILKEDKNYSLDKQWILQLRDFAQNLQDAYFTESGRVKDVQALGEDIKVYTFDNLIDLDKFWNVVVKKWYEADTSTGKKIYPQLSSHAWYNLCQVQEEAAIIEVMKKHGIQFYVLINGDTFLDRWCAQYYQKQGVMCVTNKDKKKPGNERYFSIYKDNIIQSTYSDELTKDIDAVFEETKNFETFDIVKLITILRRKTEVKVTVMRNALVAEQMSNFIMKRFGK